MRLDSLDLSGSGVTDLSPLRDMPLTELDLFNASQLKDLLPLNGMSLKYLNVGRTSVSDLSPVGKMMTLQALILSETPLTELSALQGLPLRSLRMEKTSIPDLAPLKGMPLKQLWFDLRGGPDEAVVRSLTGLEQINNLPAEEFWKSQGK